MGFKGDVFGKWSFRLEGDFSTSGDEFFNRTTDTWISYRTSNGLEFILGKQSAAFTLDGHTSSNNLQTTERSILGNNVWFPGEYFTGAAVKTAGPSWTTVFGVFSSGSENEWLGNFDGSGFVLGSVAYDFAARHGLDKGELTADLVYQNPDENNDATLPNEWVGSLSLQLKRDRWGLEGNVSATRGYYGQGDLSGFTVMPLFDLTDTFQFALRYSYLDSDEPLGIRPGRYTNKVAYGRGDHYQDIYAGINAYIDGHRLKIQLGLQWTEMEDSTESGGDFSGFGWTLALRTNW
jgi:phosphate-selective porin OprO/OprP